MHEDIWPITWSMDTATITPEQKTLAEQFAVGVLISLTARRIGNFPVTVMPCSGHCAHPRNPGNPFHPILLDTGRMANCFCSSGCSCESTPAVLLDGPVGSITSVLIDGEVVPPSEYRLETGDRLVRLGGGGWPSCSGDRFTVTYMNGHAPGALGSYAAGVMASEYLKLIAGDKKCRLPSGVTSINRQGISIEIEPGLFPGGKTGIPEVDAFLMMVNPYGLRSAPRIFSIDSKRNRQKTWGI